MAQASKKSAEETGKFYTSAAVGFIARFGDGGTIKPGDGTVSDVDADHGLESRLEAIKDSDRFSVIREVG